MIPSERVETKDDAFALLSLKPEELFARADRVREVHKGKLIRVCSLVNAKSGDCPEDCKFCAQSSHHRTGAPVYPLKTPAEVASAARRAALWHRDSFCVVTSGRTVSPEEFEGILAMADQIRTLGFDPHVSLGETDAERAAKLRDRGVACYNHNLETSRRHYPNICTTHTFDDRLRTARLVKQAGLQLCCGGIFGMGETWADRVELALSLREVGADCIPLNFLHPVPGTPLDRLALLRPMEALQVVALFRLMLPEADIKVAGGRALVLRDLQSWIFYAGANGLIIGDYLTTRNRSPEDDLQMIEDLGFEFRK